MPVTNVSHVFDALPRIDLGARPIGELLTSPNGRRDVEALLPAYLKGADGGGQRWFTGKDRQLEHVSLGSRVSLDDASSLAMIDVRYVDAAPERYAHVLTARPVDDVDPTAVLAPMAVVRAGGRDHVLFDGMSDVGAVQGLMDVMRGERALVGRGGRLAGEGSAAMTDAMRGAHQVSVRPLSLETSNTTMLVGLPDGSKQAVKLVRRHDGIIEPGTPTRALDVVMGAHLTNDTDFANTPGVFGSIDHVDDAGVPRTVAVATDFVANDGDAWKHALGDVDDMLRLAAAGDVAGADAVMARYSQMARTQGQRLGEMHVALASGGPRSEFRGVRPTADQLAKVEARLDADVNATVAAIRAKGLALPGGMSIDDFERALRGSVADMRTATATGAPDEWIHAHGDFHLGQMLRQNDDVQIIDLEGSPILPVAERWERANPLIDVARNRSSYEYAGTTGLKAFAAVGAAPDAELSAHARAWSARASEAFLDGWRESTGGAAFAPSAADLPTALRRAELANALYETRYELGSRPDWVGIPLDRLARITGE